MTAKKNTPITKTYDNPPKTLTDSLFYGLKLNEEQKIFRDAIWDEQYDIVFCAAKAGTGKTLVSVATAMLACEYGKYSDITYMSAAGIFEGTQGLLPGTQEEKSKLYSIPLRQALIRLNYNPDAVIVGDNMEALKNGTACVHTDTNSWIRGTNIGDSENKAILIVEEAQNFNRMAMKTVLSRLGRGSKAILIGDPLQCDLKHPSDSAFINAIHLYEKNDWCKVCELKECFRSRVAELAEEL